MVHCLRSSKLHGSQAARSVTPERLDHLPAGDPLAVGSRRDLRLIHRVMGTVAALKGALRRLDCRQPPKRILELGAGDGSLLLRLAGALQPSWRGIGLTLLDRQDLISQSVRTSYRELDWQVTVMHMDAMDWARTPSDQHYDLCVTTLFLHHFNCAELRVLLTAVIGQSEALIACEPRRSGIARLGSRMIGLLGVNEVTREDSVKSVAAGFTGQELTAMWPGSGTEWRTDEYYAFPFSHCFVAAKQGRTRRAAA